MIEYFSERFLKLFLFIWIAVPPYFIYGQVLEFYQDTATESETAMSSSPQSTSLSPEQIAELAKFKLPEAMTNPAEYGQRKLSSSNGFTAHKGS